MPARKTKPKPEDVASLDQLLAEFPFTIEVVAVDHLHANPWNPNRQDDLTQRATRESIATFGFIELPVVRAHPELEGHFQIINGEHRWREAQGLGLERLPVVVIDVDTPTAMKLTVVLDQRGDNDQAALGALLAEIRDQGGEDWSKALAFDGTTLNHLLELGSHWSPDFQGGQPPSGDGSGGAGGHDDEAWTTIEVRMPESVAQLWEQARAKAVEAQDVGEHDDERVAAGLLIEVLAASYLADA